MRNIGSGRTAATVILVGVDNDAMGRVREVLSAEAVLPTSSLAFGDALQTIKRTRPHVVIVGFGQGLEAPLALAEAINKEVAGTTLVALADSSRSEHILAAMRVGYKEYVVLPDDATRLRGAVHEAAYAPASNEEKGTVVAFMGSKGGVGTTMITAHLAAELAAIHRVLVMDMDFGMGDLASELDLNPKDSIADMLPRADRMDERMLTGAAIVHRSKAHVIAQPSEHDSSLEIRADDIYNIINAAAKGYQYVLIDCGSYIDDAVAMSLSVADLVVIITNPTVISVRDAFRRIKNLDALGVDKERVRLVVNRWYKGAFVSLEDIEQNLSMKIVGSIPEDPRTVDVAINEGKLVREVNRKSDVAKAISMLVGMLTDESEAPKPDPGEAQKGGFFFGLFNKG